MECSRQFLMTDEKLRFCVASIISTAEKYYIKAKYWPSSGRGGHKDRDVGAQIALPKVNRSVKM